MELPPELLTVSTLQPQKTHQNIHRTQMENRFFKGPAAKITVRADCSMQGQSLSRTVLLVAFYKTLPLSLCLQNRVPYQLFYLFSRS